MGNMIKMIVVLVGISLISGIALGGLNRLTKEKGEQNVLKFKKVPAVISIIEGVSGKMSEADEEKVTQELLSSYKMIDVGEEQELLMFVTKKDGKPNTIVIEREGEGGYGGNIGVMVGFNIQSGNLDGIGITTHSETPGLGARVTEPAFQHQFIGMSKDSVFKIKKNGGIIDQVSGATKSSGAVADAIRKAKATYDQHKDELEEAVK